MTRSERLALAMSLEGPAAELAWEAYLAFRRTELERCDVLVDAALAAHREFLRTGEEPKGSVSCAARAFGL